MTIIREFRLCFYFYYFVLPLRFFFYFSFILVVCYTLFYILHRRNDNFGGNKVMRSNNKMRIKVKSIFIYIYIFFINSKIEFIKKFEILASSTFCDNFYFVSYTSSFRSKRSFIKFFELCFNIFTSHTIFYFTEFYHLKKFWKNFINSILLL